MTSKEVWRAVAAYCKIYQNFSNFPIEIHPKSHVVSKLPFSRLKYFFVTSFAILYGVLSFLVLLIGRVLGHSISAEIPTWIILTQIFFLGFGCYCLLIHCLILRFGHLLPDLLKKGIAFEKKVRKRKSTQE